MREKRLAPRKITTRFTLDKGYVPVSVSNESEARVKSSLDVGVIGVGSMGANHARVLSQISNLAGVFDTNAGRAKEVAERFGTSPYQDADSLLADVDAVSIALPTSLHNQMLERAVRHGTHALIEKPISIDPQATLKLLKSAEQMGLQVAAGHIERFNPAVGFARTALEKGQFGHLIGMSAKRVSSFPTRVRDVGVVLDLAIHDLDVMCYLVPARVVRVFASGGRANGGEFEDHATVLLEFENGVTGTSETSWLTPMKVRKLALTCDKKYVELDYMSQSVQVSSHVYTDIDPARLYDMPSQLSEQRVNLERQEPLQLELGNFLRAAEGREKLLVPGVEGVKAVQLGLDALRSMRTREAVSLA